MMGHKDKLKTGLEYDVIYARKRYCYLCNRPDNVKYAKNQINRRNRYKEKLFLKNNNFFLTNRVN